MITKAPPSEPGLSQTPPAPPPRRPGPIRRTPAWIKGPVVVAIIAVGMFVGLKAAYGGFGHYYTLSVDLPRASQQLSKGSDVRMSGVIIGKVTDIRLVDRQVHVTLTIERQYRIPADATAQVDLTTLLGAKFINIRFPDYGGPFLASGQRIQKGVVGPELEDALANGVGVLSAVKPTDLATIVHELTVGSEGHGEDVAKSIQYNTALTRIFARTLDPQLKSLHDFTVVFGALKNSGIDLNALADAINQGVPVYASKQAQAQLDQALRALVPFSNNLGDLLTLNRADWDRMITNGDAVLGTIAARPEQLQRLVHGLYQYVYKLGGDPNYLPDGSAQAGFTDFIGGNDAEQNRAQICAAFPPDVRSQVPLCAGTAP